MSDSMDHDVREVIRRRIALRERDGHERLLLSHVDLRALLDACDERDRLAAERDAFIAGIGFTPAADLVELVEPLSKRMGDAVEHRQCAEELAWEKRQHESRMAEARESHERFLHDAHRVSDAYNTVASPTCSTGSRWFGLMAMSDHTHRQDVLDFEEPA